MWGACHLPSGLSQICINTTPAIKRTYNRNSKFVTCFNKFLTLFSVAVRVCFVFWLLFSFDLRRSRYICFTTGPAEVEWEGNIAAALEAIWFYNLVFLRFYTCHYCPADSVTSCRSCGLSVSSFQFVRVTVVLLTPCHCVGATADLQGWQEIQTPLRRSIHV